MLILVTHKEHSTAHAAWGCRLAWSRLVASGAIDAGSNPASPITGFLSTANLKTESRLNESEGELWFTVANVALKTQTTQRYAPTVAHPYTL